MCRTRCSATADAALSMSCPEHQAAAGVGRPGFQPGGDSRVVLTDLEGSSVLPDSG